MYHIANLHLQEYNFHIGQRISCMHAYILPSPSFYKCLVISGFQLICSTATIVTGLGVITSSFYDCIAVGGVISEVFCIHDDGSPEAVRESC